MEEPPDCTRALRELYEFLDGELTIDRRNRLKTHLDGCSHCFSAFDFEAELREVVKSRLSAEVPESLRLRVHRALLVEGYQPPPGSFGLGTGRLGRPLL
ncbi:MAG: mycothiol system anti-sigma-R factor [Acidimicrobiia bacterium]|nr:mycothiol system anti-sigma-R factor [Acidimicrobiia bacterium]